MKKLFTILSLLIAGTATVTNALAQNTTRPARFMSYNVRHCAGMDNKINITRTAQVISEANAEVVAIQELDSMTSRSNKVYQLQELGKKTNMNYTFARSIPYGGGSYGVGILSKEKPLNVKRIPIPDTNEARVLLVCEFEDYVFSCTHLPLTNKGREDAIPIIVDEAMQHTKPFFVSGDFNMEPSDGTMQRMRQYFKILTSKTDNTFPADEPTGMIDYICSYRKSYTVIEAYVPNEPMASDHRPVVVEFNLPYTPPTGITMPWRKADTETIYDLNGNRVDANNLKKGIYIRNNKKIIINN